MTKKKIAAGVVPDYVMSKILHILQRINFGEVILVAQDGILVQVEWNEKIRLENFAVGHEMKKWEEKVCEYVSAHIRHEFAHLSYGRLVIVVKHGDVIQIERTEKQRFTGLDGEGI